MLPHWSPALGAAHAASRPWCLAPGGVLSTEDTSSCRLGTRPEVGFTACPSPSPHSTPHVQPDSTTPPVASTFFPLLHQSKQASSSSRLLISHQQRRRPAPFFPSSPPTRPSVPSSVPHLPCCFSFPLLHPSPALRFVSATPHANLHPPKEINRVSDCDDKLWECALCGCVNCAIWLCVLHLLWSLAFAFPVPIFE